MPDYERFDEEGNMYVATVDPPFESFLCPIGQMLMRDPVITVDGHSYERRQIEAWFGSQDKPTSPITSEALPSKTLIPNHALRSAINKYYETLPRDVQAQVDLDAAELPTISLKSKKTVMPTVLAMPVDGANVPPDAAIVHGVALRSNASGAWSWASQDCVADRVEVVGNGAVLRRKEQGGRFTDVAAFASRPLRLFYGEPMVFAIQIIKASYAWGGICMGVAPEFTPGEAYSLETHLERNSWYLDGDRWFRSPLDENNQLVSLSTANLKEGHVLALQVEDTGAISYSVNGKQIFRIDGAVVDVSQPLVPWVALMGNCAEVTLDCRVPTGVQ
eukprot:GEMP01036873.1.p1 GENE.GEMP01036873.1~~GEMP01036873.1.p1  ORF type:complete len:332 (+),score=76.91 GEMP01036873.1:247-1242(+)